MRMSNPGFGEEGENVDEGETEGMLVIVGEDRGDIGLEGDEYLLYDMIQRRKQSSASNNESVQVYLEKVATEDTLGCNA